jgi:CO/xanthine dehydrogenase FAD-binding subunit
MKYGLDCPEVVVSLKGIRSKPPSITDDDGLLIDGLMTLTDIVHSPTLKERVPLLVDAAHSVGSNQIRNMGTLGGNLCQEPRCTYFNQTHNYQYVEPCFKRAGERCFLVSKGRRCQAVFMGDTVPALMCLDAEVLIQSEDGHRAVRVEDLYTGDPLMPLALTKTELLSGILIPPATKQRCTAYSKFSTRGGLEFAAFTIAVLLGMSESGTIGKIVRIGVGALSAKPQRAVKAEAALSGETPTEELLREVAKLIAAEVRIVMHHSYSVNYLKHTLEVQAFRTLTQAVQNDPKQAQSAGIT